MSGFEFSKEPLSVAAFTLPCLLQALADAFPRVSECGNIEICFSILHNPLSFTLGSQSYGPLALFEMLHKVAGAPSERCEGLNILRGVEHENLFIKEYHFLEMNVDSRGQGHSTKPSFADLAHGGERSAGGNEFADHAFGGFFAEALHGIGHQYHRPAGF